MPNEFVIRNGAAISSSLSVTGSTNITGFSDVLNAQASAGGTAPIFNVFGTAGQLFTVTDGLEGSLFSVNTISGLPIIEAFSTGRINLGAYSSPALIVNGPKVNKLDLSGSLQLTGSILGTNNSFISLGTTSSVARINAYGTTNVVSVYGSTSEGVMFDVNGPSGQLFSVVDGLSGSLFSVNTISGLPIMEAFSDATIRMGNYSLPALIITGSQAIITGSITSASFASTASFVNPLIQSVRLTGSLFISASFSTSSAALSAYKSGSTVLDIQGSQGQLFSVVDSLTGSLMSVNDVSGLPILEVFSNDTVVMGTYGNPALIISGSVANVTGSLVTQGQTIDPALIWFMS
jgi:hypothetical protein